MIGLAAGIVLGLVLHETGASLWRALGVGDAAAYLGGRESEENAAAGVGAAAAAFLVKLNLLVGELFVRALRFIAIPIILFMLVVAVGGVEDVRRLGRIGARTVALFAATTVVAVTVGLVVGNVAGPGRGIGSQTRDAIAAAQASAAAEPIRRAQTTSAWDLVREAVSKNPFDSLARGDALQVVVFSLAIGLVLGIMPREKSRPVLEVFGGLAHALITLVGLLMRVAPVAVFALITPIMADLGVGMLRALLAYCLSVVGGLLVMLLVVYPAILRALTPVKVGAFFRAILPAQLFAFTSSSSAATLPVTIRCVRTRLGVPEDITGFVCSVGTTINMDGTAVMQCIAAVFIAQLYGVDLTVGQQVTIAFTALLASVGAPGIPSGGIVMLVVVLETAGLPVQGIAVILAVDRLLDMLRTIVNVTGDALASVVVASAEGEAPAGALPDAAAEEDP